MFTSRVSSQAFLKADLENILRSIMRARRPHGRRDLDPETEAYWEGFSEAIACVADALDITGQELVRGDRRAFW